MTERFDTRHPASIVGRRIKELRQARGWTQEMLGMHFRRLLDSDFTRDTVAALERGARDLSLPEFLSLPLVFDLELPDFFAGIDRFTLGRAGALSGRAVQAMLRGHFLELSSAGRSLIPVHADTQAELNFGSERKRRAASGSDDTEIRELDAVSRVAERKVALQLGIEASAVVRAALSLWGRTLSEERDHRVQRELTPSTIERTDPRSVQALRGHVSRVLIRELKRHFTEGRS